MRIFLWVSSMFKLRFDMGQKPKVWLVLDIVSKCSEVLGEPRTFSKAIEYYILILLLSIWKAKPRS